MKITEWVRCPVCGNKTRLSDSHYNGHKVWRSRGKNQNRYDVWYCNHRYSGETKCKTPTIREEDIQAAFIKAMNTTKQPISTFTDKLWREMVECATIYEDGRIVFLLADGKTATTWLKQ